MCLDAAGAAEESEGDARAADGALVDCVAGHQYGRGGLGGAGCAKGVEDREGDAVFGGAARVEEFEFGVDIAVGQTREVWEEDEGRVAYGGLEAGAGGWDVCF